MMRQTLEQLPLEAQVARYHELKQALDELGAELDELNSGIKETLGVGKHRIGNYMVNIFEQNRTRYEWGKVPPYLLKKMGRFRMDTQSESLRVSKL